MTSMRDFKILSLKDEKISILEDKQMTDDEKQKKIEHLNKKFADIERYENSLSFDQNLPIAFETVPKEFFTNYPQFEKIKSEDFSRICGLLKKFK